ncbi:hypothetical protein [Microbacterium soli]|uniref:PqqD family protein n=1 Tax=Microbacterium soli TaxID=446075 RepID=A0ABP7MUI6_9MICO
MRVAIAENVGVVEEDGLVYVATLPDGPILVLSDDAAAAWRAAGAAAGSDRETEDYVAAFIEAGLLTIEKDD